MMSLSNPSQLSIRAGDEPIPGYRVDSLLGRGGFGEVWKCQAPGGLWKAIKFVYGTVGQDRATRELKSLNRIKDAQHPFLLTLERFEFIDGRLVIVTELADGSLEEEFMQRRARGSCGIPREQLLACLGDAADALDYLHQQHRLLHLDIKPGNLLLQGGHVKVADFGLLKDLKELDCSLVAGLTPVYAPPELFDGRPTVPSDQYSLAVVYQELLTGGRPFSGRTIAQLATQHIHAAPNLSLLPPADRPVIARALEKNPQRRFASCREFIAALHQAGLRSAAAPVPMASLAGGEPLARLTAGWGGNDASADRLADGLRPPPVAIDELPPLNLASSVAHRQPPLGSAQRHALVIALGGSGREILGHLHRLVRQPHDGHPLAVHSLLIDTDVDSLHGADRLLRGDDRSTVQTLYLPLRSASEYQQVPAGRLRSISRRWLFNVPRNGQTVGLRPLGRLALVDHCQRVSRALDGVVADYQRLLSGGPPAVYVVGSLDGGTGSGIMYDVMHLLRHSLDQHGLEHAKVIPLLATTALTATTAPTLAAHNSACALSEMAHLTKIAHGYPGDAGAGWPSVPAARSPLGDAYVVAAGADQGPAPVPAQTIAHYVWLDAAAAGRVLEAARQPEGEHRVAELASARVRSVGLFRLEFPGGIEETLHAPMLVLRLTQQWCGPVVEGTEALAPLTARYLRDSSFTAADVLRGCWGWWPEGRSQRLERLARWHREHWMAVAGQSNSLDQALDELARHTFGKGGQQEPLKQWVPIQNRLLDGLVGNRLTLHEALAVVRQARMIAEAELAQVHAGSDAQQPLVLPSAAATAGEIVAYSERWLWRSVCQAAAQQYTRWLTAIAKLEQRLNDCLQAITRANRRLTAALEAESAPQWQAMDATWQQLAQSAVQQMLRQLAPRLLIAPLVDGPAAEPLASGGAAPPVRLADLLQEAAGLARALRLAAADAIAVGGEAHLPLPPDHAVGDSAADSRLGTPSAVEQPVAVPPPTGVVVDRDSADSSSATDPQAETRAEIRAWSQVDTLAESRSLLFTDEPGAFCEGANALRNEPDAPSDGAGTIGDGAEQAMSAGTAGAELAAERRPVPIEPIESVRREPSDYRALAATALAAVRPKLLECGGSQRLLLLVGSEDDRRLWATALADCHDGALTTVVVPGVPATLVCEAQGTKLADLKARVVAAVGGRDDVLARLHSRCDVSWG